MVDYFPIGSLINLRSFVLNRPFSPTYIV